MKFLIGWFKRFTALFSPQMIRDFFRKPLSHSLAVKLLIGLRIVWHLFNKKGVWAHASVCGYSTILSLVPMAAISLMILSAFTSQTPELNNYTIPKNELQQERNLTKPESPFDEVNEKYNIEGSSSASFSNQVFDFIFDHFVPGAASDAKDELQQVKTEVLEFIQRASALRFVTLVFLILAGVSLFNSIEHAFNEIWSVRHRRTLFSRFLACWLLLTLTPLLLGLSYYYSTQFAARLSSSGWLQMSWTPWILNHLISYALTLFAFLVANRYLPNQQVNIFPALIGSAVAAILWETAKAGFDVYVRYITSQPSSYYSIFGTVAAIPIFIMWLYYSYLCFLLGPVIATTIQDYDQHLNRMKRKEWISFHRPIHSLKIFLEICRHFLEMGEGVTINDLTKNTGWSARRVKRCLHDLTQVRLIHQAKVGEQFYPSGDPDGLMVSDVIERLLGLKSFRAKPPILFEPWQNSLKQVFETYQDKSVTSLLDAQ